MPMDAQTRLLRVLQSGEFTTVGGARTIRADVRIVAATNKDLSALVQLGRGERLQVAGCPARFLCHRPSTARDRPPAVSGACARAFRARAAKARARRL